MMSHGRRFRFSTRTLFVMLSICALILAVFVWAIDRQPFIRVERGDVAAVGSAVIARSWHPSYGSQCAVVLQFSPSSFYIEPYVIGFPHHSESVEVVRQGIFVNGEQISHWDRSYLLVVFGRKGAREWREVPVPEDVLRGAYVDTNGQIAGLDDYLNNLQETSEAPDG